ncbi:tRNA lysidine(34) synthetase TilS [Mesoplasma syrphidae]|uniref:tRNA(Ile)-lysidine synthase n=1 Tax=Mesoplasma syrphidae TaxID=225999 RepID=A0A2K9BSC4_9MOLU|nr:tRNA lysidine(34) synthetase TilS [Mesoplasma syrphidae]AUF83902.1 tRNA lysidine(34) synthetase TilS [Mesoplasma syrphidae]
MINLNRNEKYLVAVSGGPDSIFLLNSVKNYEVIVCHVNYRFRSDSNNDQRIVEEFCSANQIKCEILNVECEYSNLKQNFEEFARETRYNFFNKIGIKYGIKNLLVAHNFNDLVETYIMQKRRQNNVDFFGLRSITTYKSLTIIRPMLNFLKSSILESLNSFNIEYANDLTNLDSKYLRNEIRSQLNEKDFENYYFQINKENKQLEKLKNEVKFYTLNNLSADELILQKKLTSFSQEKIQRILFYFLKTIKKDYLLQKRKNSTIKEIAWRLKTSNKPFWKIKLDDFFLIKDFDRLFLAPSTAFDFKTIIIKSQQDLYLAEEFVNWLEIFTTIKNDRERYPYVITNNYEVYKQTTFVEFVKTNRYLIDNKIRYRNRIYKAVVYKENELKILNKMTR